MRQRLIVFSVIFLITFLIGVFAILLILGVFNLGDREAITLFENELTMLRMAYMWTMEVYPQSVELAKALILVLKN